MSAIPITVAVAGYCPVCGGRSLVATSQGQIMCTARQCPKRTAVSRLLADPETEHVVEVDEFGGFTVQHPLRERLDGQLFACRVLAMVYAASRVDRVPHVPRLDGEPGRYRFTPLPDGAVQFDRLEGGG